MKEYDNNLRTKKTKVTTDNKNFRLCFSVPFITFK